MAEKKSSSKRIYDDEFNKSAPTAASEPASEEVKTKAVIPVPEPEPVNVPPVQPSVSFARWFKARSKERGFKPHWAKGMQKYTNTSSSRSMEEWDRIFSNY